SLVGAPESSNQVRDIFASDEDRQLSPIHRYFMRGLRAFFGQTLRKDLNALTVFVEGERFHDRLFDRQCCQPVLAPGRSPPEKGGGRTHEEENEERCHDRRRRGYVMH
ncbi:hypothetical protein A2U01_0054989, partial [Trifolium medium]|nr:hypothetical protein [Trifolium medium]